MFLIPLNSFAFGQTATSSEAPKFVPLVPFSEEIPEKRWGRKNVDEFLKLLNQFYADAACETFFKENRPLHTEASRRFQKIYEALDIDWYQKFYGLANPTLHGKFTL
ncbi:MAG: DUF4932 domain-containing protein [Bacteroidia bacterium]|nr:DUF4932 domain-containing protein [Bacteroidia bacterium]